MSRMTTYILILSSLTFSSLSTASSGDKGNGGDSYSFKFSYIAQRISNYFTNHAGELPFKASSFAEAVSKTAIESTDEPLLLNGSPKDAINYPRENRIVFNRQRWDALKNDERISLVLHEFFSLEGIEGANYSKSRTLLDDYLRAAGANSVVDTNPYDDSPIDRSVRLSEISNCGQSILGRAGHAICPVLDAGTPSKLLIRSDSERGDFWLVWRAYWINHRPLLSSLTISVVLEKAGSSQVLEARTIYPVTDEDGGQGLEDKSPDSLFINVKGGHGTIRQIWFKFNSAGDSIEQERNEQLVDFKIES